MKALFVGRFQPFHNGHLKIIKGLCNDFDKIIIGIGSSQYNNTLENPFTDKERKEMIERALLENGIVNFKIILIPDIHNPPKWVEHVVSIEPNFDAVIANNQLTKQLFFEKGYRIIETPFFDRDNLSGKEIRKRIIENKNWQELVPSAVVRTIANINGVKRLQKIAKNN